MCRIFVILSNASCVALGMAIAVCQSTTLVQTETTIGWIAMKFCTDIHGPQMMNFISSINL